jgi:uncharacterized membrane protein YphA (DoxX/SURF4 family)
MTPRRAGAISLVAALAMVVAGFVTILWSGARTSADAQVNAQMPFAVSGGLVGLALVGSGALLAHLLIGRHLARRHDAAVADVIVSLRA